MVLVTGANGFVGRALYAELVCRGYLVRGAVRESSLAFKLPGEVVVVGDIGGDTDWSPALAGVQVVVHLAARVHVMHETVADPLAAFRRVNVEATAGFARAAARRRVRRFVYVSSVKVNGEVTTDKPFAPDELPHPQDAYAVSKWEAEQALWRVAEETGLEVIVVRLPLVYGPGVGGNFRRLLKLIERGVPLPLASIDNRRSMIYVGNLADALIACAVHPAAAGNTYLVSDGENISTPKLVGELARLMGKSARLWPFPPALLRSAGWLIGKAGEVERLIGSLQVDSSRIRVELQWMPPFTVAQGLAETVQWFVNQGRHPLDAA